MIGEGFTNHPRVLMRQELGLKPWQIIAAERACRVSRSKQRCPILFFRFSFFVFEPILNQQESTVTMTIPTSSSTMMLFLLLLGMALVHIEGALPVGTYSFERDGKNSVSFGGQTTRLNMADELYDGMNSNEYVWLPSSFCLFFFLLTNSSSSSSSSSSLSLSLSPSLSRSIPH